MFGQTERNAVAIAVIWRADTAATAGQNCLMTVSEHRAAHIQTQQFRSLKAPLLWKAYRQPYQCRAILGCAEIRHWPNDSGIHRNNNLVT